MDETSAFHPLRTLAAYVRFRPIADISLVATFAGMRTRAKVVLSAAVIALAAVGVAVVALGSVDARQIGRTDPKRAANYRVPWFNFSETYVDGEALGVVIGSTRAEAIRAAERASFTVGPSGWGDNRAGGADLYTRPEIARDDEESAAPKLLRRLRYQTRNDRPLPWRPCSVREHLLHQQRGPLDARPTVRFPPFADLRR